MRESLEQTAPEAAPRSLVLDLYGDYVRYHGGELPLLALVRLLGCFGVAEANVRVTMSRLRNSGLFAARREGRQTLYRLTETGLHIMDEGRERIFRRGENRWQGEWSMVIYSVPETDRAARDRVRRSLQWLGFGPLAPSTWISPHDRLSEVAEELKGETSVRLDLLRASSLSLTGDRELAVRCWDLDSLQADYRQLLRRLAARHRLYQAGKLSDRDAFLERMRLVHEYRMLPYRDPDLPVELLPEGWAGMEAHTSFLEAHRWLRRPADRFYLSETNV